MYIYIVGEGIWYWLAFSDEFSALKAGVPDLGPIYSAQNKLETCQFPLIFLFPHNSI